MNGGTAFRRADAAIFMTGDDALIRVLMELSRATQRKIMRPAIGAGLRVLRTEARRRAPTRSIARLIKSKVHVGGRGKRSRLIGQVFVDDDPNRTVMWEGQEFNFSLAAKVLEFGSYNQNIRARDYMRGARDAKGPQALAAVRVKALERIVALWKRDQMALSPSAKRKGGKQSGFLSKVRAL